MVPPKGIGVDLPVDSLLSIPVSVVMISNAVHALPVMSVVGPTHTHTHTHTPQSMGTIAGKLRH